MKAKFQSLRAMSTRARDALAFAAVSVLAASATAQTATPFETLMDGIALSDMTTKIVAIGLLIIGIAVAFKGITVAKRAVSKV